MSLSVAVVMGSDSDLPKLSGCFDTLKKFDISFRAHVISAHRTPRAAEEFATNARDNGVGVIIAAAGKAAHLAGVIAAYTTLPVVAIPIKASLEGLDALLSMVQMPKGIPVATVAIDGAENAAILAAQILSLSDTKLADKLAWFKKEMADEVIRKNEQLKI